MLIENKELLTEVISRMTSIGEDYITALKKLNEQFPCTIPSGFNSTAIRSLVKFEGLASLSVKLKSNPMIQGTITNHRYDKDGSLEVQVNWYYHQLTEEWFPIDKLFVKLK